MPSAPQRLCSCGTYYPSGQGCPTCAGTKEQQRGTRHERGYTNEWDRYSKGRLARYPLCVGYPAGLHDKAPVLAQCTDHIVSAKQRPDLFWEPSNHASLCMDCNRRKAIETEGGLGR